MNGERRISSRTSYDRLMYSNKLSGSMRALTMVEAQVMATDNAKSALKREHLNGYTIKEKWVTTSRFRPKPQRLRELERKLVRESKSEREKEGPRKKERKRKHTHAFRAS